MTFDTRRTKRAKKKFHYREKSPSKNPNSTLLRVCVSSSKIYEDAVRWRKLSPCPASSSLRVATCRESRLEPLKILTSEILKCSQRQRRQRQPVRAGRFEFHLVSGPWYVTQSSPGSFRFPARVPAFPPPLVLRTRATWTLTPNPRDGCRICVIREQSALPLRKSRRQWSLSWLKQLAATAAVSEIQRKREKRKKRDARCRAIRL